AGAFVLPVFVLPLLVSFEDCSFLLPPQPARSALLNAATTRIVAATVSGRIAAPVFDRVFMARHASTGRWQRQTCASEELRRRYACRVSLRECRNRKGSRESRMNRFSGCLFPRGRGVTGMNPFALPA